MRKLILLVLLFLTACSGGLLTDDAGAPVNLRVIGSSLGQHGTYLIVKSDQGGRLEGVNFAFRRLGDNLTVSVGDVAIPPGGNGVEIFTGVQDGDCAWLISASKPVSFFQSSPIVIVDAPGTSSNKFAGVCGG